MLRPAINAEHFCADRIVVAQVPRGTGADRLTTAPTPRPTGIDRLRHLSAQGSVRATVAALAHRRRLAVSPAPCGARPLPRSGLRRRLRRSRPAIAAISQLSPPIGNLCRIGAHQHNEVFEYIPAVSECQLGDVMHSACIGVLHHGNHVSIGRPVSLETNASITGGLEPSRCHHFTLRMRPVPRVYSIGVPGGGR